MKMLPFDLEKAKAGHPICTRDWRNVKFVAYVAECRDWCRVVGLIQGYDTTTNYCENGKRNQGDNGLSDLFLIAPEPKTQWINIYKPEDNNESACFIHESRESADACSSNRIACLSFVEGQGIEESK